MKTNLRIAGGLLALLFLIAAQVSGPASGPGSGTAAAQEVRQAMADTFDVLRQATWWNDYDGQFNPAPAEDTCCEGGDCGMCGQCCRPLDMWCQAEYLMWWGKGSQMPPLVTTSVPANVPRPQAGVLGFPTTQILSGDEVFGDEVQSGVRLDVGIWLDPCHNVGAGARVFGLEGDTHNFYADSTGDPVLARPFFNNITQLQDSLLVAYVDPVNGPVAEGSVAVNYNSSFVGTDAYMRIMMERNPINRIDIVGGYSYFRLGDNLSIRSHHTATDVLLNGTQFDIRDNFATSNVFHGGMLGLMGRRARGRWSIDWLTKLSLGSNHQKVRIAGTSTITPPAGVPNTFVGGLLAQPSNIGTFDDSKTVVVPELTVNLNYHLNTNWSVGVGYNFMWISSAVTSGPQIDFTVDRQQVVQPLRPAFAFNDDDYWLQGINFALRAEY